MQPDSLNRHPGALLTPLVTCAPLLPARISCLKLGRPQRPGAQGRQLSFELGSEEGTTDRKRKAPDPVSFACRRDPSNCVASGCRSGHTAHSRKRIQNRDPVGLEVGGVAGDQHEVMRERRGPDETVSHRNRLADSKHSPTQSDALIDGMDAVGILETQTLQPAVKRDNLGGIAEAQAFGASPDFSQSNDAEMKGLELRLLCPRRAS